MKVIIAGGRDLRDRALLDEAIEASSYTITEIVQGGCPTGADLFARLWAEHHGIPVESYPADWNRYGRSAGPKRNEQMVRDSGSEDLIALWDGKSTGTGGMIRLARKYGLKVFVLRVDLQGEKRYQRIKGKHDRSGLLLNVFTLAKADRVQVGDLLTINPCWNETSSEKIADKVKCLAVRRERSQSGIEFLILTNKNRKTWLDAAWFLFDEARSNQLTLL